MRKKEQIPQVPLTATMNELLNEMSKKGLGVTAVVDDLGRPCGIFTDGDLRRLIEKGGSLKELLAKDIMQKNPQTIYQKSLAVDVVGMMEKLRINTMLVVDEAHVLIGALNTNDLMRAKVI
jgi:arabinose-5-phosphate isomerase